MRAHGTFMAIMLACLVQPPLAFAGLYSTEEPPQETRPPERGVQAMPPERFVKFFLPELMQVANSRMADPELTRYMEQSRTAQTDEEKKQLHEHLRADLKALPAYFPLWEKYAKRKN